MTLALRLQRHGRKSRPFYHVVAADIRSPRDGKFKEKIGYYDPTREPSVIEINADRMQYYYSNGAQLSNTVKNLARIKKIALTRGAIRVEASAETDTSADSSPLSRSETSAEAEASANTEETAASANTEETEDKSREEIPSAETSPTE